MGSTYELLWVTLLWVVHMSHITMGITYESNYYGYIHMSQITMGNTYESNYYGYI